MKKQILFSLFLLGLFLLSFMIIPHQEKSNIYPDTTIETDTIVGENYGILANYSITGDFLGWEETSGNIIYFDNTGSFLQGNQGYATGTCARYYLNISTNTVKGYKLYCTAHLLTGGGTYNLRIYYTDGTYLLLFDQSTFDTVSYVWFNGSFTANKQLHYIRYYASSGVSGGSHFSLETELYNGWFPSLWNYTDYTGLPKQIDTNINFNTFARNCSLVQTHFLTTWGTTYDLDLISDWTYQYRYFGITQLHNAILYRYYYVASNEWGVATVSPLCFLSIMEHPFPQSATLNLYSTIDGLGIDTNLFQYYMGTSEEISLVDFNTYYGNWSKLYLSSNISARFIDNYIQFKCANNGIKTTFEDMDTIDTLDYNTLLFEVQVFNPMWVVTIFNPSMHMSDNYYYYFNTSNVGNWYSVVIPFFNFTNYWSYSTLLGELGFWISSGRVNIANIRAAHYYDAHIGYYPLNMSDISIQASIDDAYFTSIAGGNWINNYPNILVYSTGGYYGNIYLRFPISLTEQTITSTILKIYVESVGTPGSVKVYLLDLDNCPAFPSGAGNENSYPNTSTCISSTISSAGWKEINITTLLQAFINRVGYISGNYIGLRIASLSGHLITLRSFNYGGTIPRLQNITVLEPFYYYTADSYRLVAPENAMNPNNFIFYEETETLVILDFFNNTIWRGTVTYPGYYSNVYIKIGLPITNLYLINYENYSIIVDVQRGLGVYIQVVVPQSSMISVRIFSTSYLVTIRNLEMILLNITSVSCNSSKTVIVPFGKPKSLTIPSLDIMGIVNYLYLGIVILGLVYLTRHFYRKVKSRPHKLTPKELLAQEKQKQLNELKKMIQKDVDRVDSYSSTAYQQSKIRSMNTKMKQGNYSGEILQPKKEEPMKKRRLVG